jgi:hypothetical protein
MSESLTDVEYPSDVESHLQARGRGGQAPPRRSPRTAVEVSVDQHAAAGHSTALHGHHDVALDDDDDAPPPLEAVPAGQMASTVSSLPYAGNANSPNPASPVGIQSTEQFQTQAKDMLTQFNDRQQMLKDAMSTPTFVAETEQMVAGLSTVVQKELTLT